MDEMNILAINCPSPSQVENVETGLKLIHHCTSLVVLLNRLQNTKIFAGKDEIYFDIVI